MFLASVKEHTFENISKELKISGSTIIQDWLTDACHKIYSAPAFFILPARLWSLHES